ncbi:hypothetical protein PUN28_005708 [Cardiocondyla obscurior]|uniref:Uncharacterized protein n=1 Tax=Cardiocondyla obscurior TaxID=286306 RepID=A0AAW2GAR1_9HYME
MCEIVRRIRIRRFVENAAAKTCFAREKEKESARMVNGNFSPCITYADIFKHPVSHRITYADQCKYARYCCNRIKNIISRYHYRKRMSSRARRPPR